MLEAAGVYTVNHYKKKTPKTATKCPQCRATNHNKGARYCYRCGADIRSEADILRERVGELLQVVQFLPDSMRDKTSDTLQAVISYLGKQ